VSVWSEAFEETAEQWADYLGRAAAETARDSAELWWGADPGWYDYWWPESGSRSPRGRRRRSDEGFRRTEDGSWAIGEFGQVELAAWDLRRTLQGAFGPEHAPELQATIRRLNSLVREIRPLVKAWVDLLEVLIFDTETRHPRASGRVKKAEVRAVVRHLVAKADVVLKLPRPVASVVDDVLTDWLVDAIVLAANRYGFWPKDTERPSIRERVAAAIVTAWRWTVLRLGYLMALIPYAVTRVWRRFQARPSPRLTAALAAVEAEHALDVKPEELVHGFAEVVVWVRDHRAEITQSIEVVFAAVEEAQRVAELDPIDQKLYARDLILFVLEDVGLDLQIGLLYTVSESVVDTLVDATFHLFRKHGVVRQPRV
jgi:hypothetical protein